MKPITIVGGGLAGLTLGIGLRQQGVPVTVWEAGRYPRHRVCGEFISGRGQEVLARLGLRNAFIDAGAVAARSAAFFFGTRRSPVRPLPQPALCLSRLKMDALLAEQFRGLGGSLRENERWREAGLGEGVVRASGRQLQPVEDGWRWFGLKAHAYNAPLSAELEMHGSQHGYVGCTSLGEGVVNVCGLFRRSAEGNDQPGAPMELLRGQPGTLLRERLTGAVFDESSFCSVAGLALRPQRATARAECCIGDALTMVPPVTGNGMSMAFEAAELAIVPLAAYSRGELSWGQAQRTIAAACDRTFARRLAWARWLQWMMFAPAFRSGLGQMALGSGWLWRLMFARTR